MASFQPRRRPVAVDVGVKVDVAEIRSLAWGLLRPRFYAGGSSRMVLRRLRPRR